MAGGDPYDDETEIASPGGKRKFLDNETQLKTAIYQGDDDATAEASPISHKDKAIEPVPERVSRVLEKADQLLTDLRQERAEVAPTIPIDEDDDEDDDGGSMLDDVTELQRPRHKLPTPRRATDTTDVAVRSVPIADGSADISIDSSVDDSIDVPLPKRLASLAIGERAETDATAVDRPNPLSRGGGMRGDLTTQVEAAPSALDGAPVDPTIPGHGAPLSDEPIAPGPMAAPTMPGDPSGGDSQGLQTLSTDKAPLGMPVPQHMQPRPALSQAPRPRGAFGSFIDSIKRVFGWRPPAPPPDYTEPEEDFSGYGAGTYTVANRHVAQRRERDRDNRDK